MFSNIRKSYGKYILKKRLKHFDRDKAVHNFESAKTACILFQCTEDEDFSIIKSFKKHLEEHKIETYIIGYVEAKQVPDHFLLRRGFNCFCQSELSWNHIPSAPFLTEFLSKEFDMLFDLSLVTLFPVHYLVSMSKAQYKIGRFTDNTSYDLMIDIARENRLAYLCEQLKHYLGIIKSSRHTVREGSF